MNIDTPFWQTVKREWSRINLYQILGVESSFQVFNKGQQVMIIDWWSFYISPTGSRIAFKVKKHYWAKGRKMNIISTLERIPSGEYVIVEKAKSNSYDDQDYVVVELVPLVLQTPRKALNWLERELDKLEAKDGKTTEDIVKEMNIRGTSR